MIGAGGELRAEAVEKQGQATRNRGEAGDTFAMELVEHPGREGRIARQHHRRPRSQHRIDLAQSVEVEERVDHTDAIPCL